MLLSEELLVSIVRLSFVERGFQAPMYVYCESFSFRIKLYYVFVFFYNTLGKFNL